MSDGTEPTSRLLRGDHEGLDQRFEDFRATPPAASGRRNVLFDQFATDLRRHIAVEERFLFPIFGEGDPSRRLLVDLMLDEHRRIEEVLQRIHLRLDAAAASTEDLESELLNVLWAHNAREEESVYPWFDTHLSVDLARTVSRELRGAGANRNEP
ncbi:MAG TPA: hemerythrin domain-containing protein [Thermoplasmata archaeon]|nr:hemerythrin domain-containing protein [Thermoplasmata archaeon]HXQ79602.1 hemerythrin domain-containing protein [Thermoplasmata archaeon]